MCYNILIITFVKNLVKMGKKMLLSSIGRKVIMALSGFFLMIFLLQHLIINLLSIINSDLFNSVSHFMGTNIFIQFILQPILITGFLVHLLMGIYLEIKNNLSRPTSYYANNASANSTWISRNMIITGIMILLFLGLHFYDFWIPEIKYKYILFTEPDENRYYVELQHKFHDIWRVIIYCISFIFLSLHLLHGFQSSFQSAGFKNRKYSSTIKKFGDIYAVTVPLGFVIIALYHCFTNFHIL